MPRKKTSKQVIPLIRGAVDTLATNPLIFIPFVTIAFIQLLVLEILYFSPRFPLSAFFNPLVKTLWGEQFIHYPSNFIILPKLFQYIQVPVYIFISSFLIASAIAIIAAINSGRKINFLSACRDIFPRYVHIFVGALISFSTFYGLYRIYTLVMVRAMKIGSVEGIYFIIKMVILKGAPYVNLFIGSFVTAIFAFVFPIIVIEKKKIFTAIGLSFKHLWGSFWFIFIVILIPTLFYLPVLLLRGNIDSIAQTTFPEVRMLALIASVLVAMFIDAVVYTSITTYYLLKKER